MAISYPVDTENTRWSVYKVSTSEIVAKRKRWPTADGNAIPGQDSDFVWLLETQETAPAYDQWTQKLETSETVDANANTVTYGWTVTALTQQEIDDKTPDHYTTTGGIKLAVEESDQNAFARMNTLIDLAAMADTDNVTIKDVFGATHSVTVADYRSIMVAYGNHCYTLFLA